MDPKDELGLIGQQIPFKGGEEYDAFTSWRRVYGWNSGTLQAIKRNYNRRVRRIVKALCSKIVKFNRFDAEPGLPCGGIEDMSTYLDAAIDAGMRGEEAEQAAILLEQQHQADWMEEDLDFIEEEYPHDYDIQLEDWIAGGEIAGDLAREEPPPSR